MALSPSNDMFKSVCRVAVVAARPLAALQQNPPEIDLFFGEPSEFEIDPQQEWVMVESRNGFFEGHRHTLRGLQMLAKEKLVLSRPLHLAFIAYPCLDFRSQNILLTSNAKLTHHNM